MSHSTYKTIEDNWDQLKVKIKEKWNKLTNDDLEKLSGSYDKLLNKLREAYGYSAKETEAKLTEFVEEFGDFGEKQITKLTEAMGECQHKIKNLEQQTVQYVQTNPLKSAVITFMMGLLVGRIISY